MKQEDATCLPSHRGHLNYKNATAKQEDLLYAMAKCYRFSARDMAYVHVETKHCFENHGSVEETIRRRLVGAATRLEDGSKAQSEYQVSTPWVELSIIETEDL